MITKKPHGSCFKVSVQYAISALYGTAGTEIQYLIITTNIFGCPGAWFEISARIYGKIKGTFLFFRVLNNIILKNHLRLRYSTQHTQDNRVILKVLFYNDLFRKILRHITRMLNKDIPSRPHNIPHVCKFVKQVLPPLPLVLRERGAEMIFRFSLQQGNPKEFQLRLLPRPFLP